MTFTYGLDLPQHFDFSSQKDKDSLFEIFQYYCEKGITNFTFSSQKIIQLSTEKEQNEFGTISKAQALLVNELIKKISSLGASPAQNFHFYVHPTYSYGDFTATTSTLGK